MAGGGGSTGGIGAQSPAVNPPSPMGQAGTAIGNAVGNAFGGAQQPVPAYAQPMVQTGQFGSQPIPVGGAQMPPAGMGFNSVQPGMQQTGQQQFTPEMMANMQQAYQAAQQTPQQPYVFQDDQQRASQAAQNINATGLMALLGGKPTFPTPTAKPTPTAQPTPTAKPAPVAAKPSVVPPRTPPGVANAIKKLAMKNPMGRR